MNATKENSKTLNDLKQNASRQFFDDNYLANLHTVDL